MTAFEPWTAGVRSGRPTNCATTNAQHILMLYEECKDGNDEEIWI